MAEENKVLNANAPRPSQILPSAEQVADLALQRWGQLAAKEANKLAHTGLVHLVTPQLKDIEHRVMFSTQAMKQVWNQAFADRNRDLVMQLVSVLDKTGSARQDMIDLCTLLERQAATCCFEPMTAEEVQRLGEVSCLRLAQMEHVGKVLLREIEVVDAMQRGEDFESLLRRKGAASRDDCVLEHKLQTCERSPNLRRVATPLSPPMASDPFCVVVDENDRITGFAIDGQLCAPATLAVEEKKGQQRLTARLCDAMLTAWSEDLEGHASMWANLNQVTVRSGFHDEAYSPAYRPELQAAWVPALAHADRGLLTQLFTTLNPEALAELASVLCEEVFEDKTLRDQHEIKSERAVLALIGTAPNTSEIEATARAAGAGTWRVLEEMRTFISLEKRVDRLNILRDPTTHHITSVWWG